MEKTLKNTPVEQDAFAPSKTIIQESSQPVNFNAETLIAKAIDQQVPVETMEKLLAMRRELKAEWAKEEFNRAMANLQSEMPIIQKNANAGSGNFTYSYSSLDYIVSQTGSLIAKHGFSYTFDSKKTDTSLITYINVNHTAGHKERSEFEITIDTGARMNISQKDGAASSYGKRYAFCNAFGIMTGDEDNDAQVPKEPAKQAKPPLQANTDTYMEFMGYIKGAKSPEELKEIHDAIIKENFSASQQAALRGAYKAKSEMFLVSEKPVKY